MLDALEMPPWIMLLQILTPAICLPLEKGLLSPTPTNQECCAVIQHCSLSSLKEKKKRNQISSLLCALQLFKWKTLFWIFLRSFSVLFLLCFQITGIHLGNTRKGKCWKAIDLPGGKLYISFSFPGFGVFFPLEKQHIIRLVKFWNHKIVL